MRRTHQRPSGTFCVTLEEHALPSRSPDGLDTVLLNERIRCDNGELLQLALGDQQSIKGITVEGRQRIHVERMTEVDGEGQGMGAVCGASVLMTSWPHCPRATPGCTMGNAPQLEAAVPPPSVCERARSGPGRCVSTRRRVWARTPIPQ